jgi:hypothetical protein
VQRDLAEVALALAARLYDDISFHVAEGHLLTYFLLTARRLRDYLGLDGVFLKHVLSRQLTLLCNVCAVVLV